MVESASIQYNAIQCHALINGCFLSIPKLEKDLQVEMHRQLRIECGTLLYIIPV